MNAQQQKEKDRIKIQQNTEKMEIKQEKDRMKEKQKKKDKIKRWQNGETVEMNQKKERMNAQQQKEKDRIKIQQNTENGDETRGRQNEGEAKKRKID